MIYDKKRISSAPKIKNQANIQIIQGKKRVKLLPENFFENILDLDLRLKIKFNPHILEELLNLLNVFKINKKIAIEFYENSGDPKYKDYQFLMESILLQPNVIKHLNKEGKEKNIVKKGEEKKLKNEKSIHNNYMKNVLLISDKNYLMVKEILKEAKKSLPQNNILIDDLNKQENDFQKKLQEKRSKRVISWNDQHDFIEEMPEDETQDFQITSNIYSNYNTSLDNIETKSNSNMVNKIEDEIQRLNTTNQINDLKMKEDNQIVFNTLPGYEMNDSISFNVKKHKKNKSISFLSYDEEVNFKLKTAKCQTFIKQISH